MFAAKASSAAVSTSSLEERAVCSNRYPFKIVKSIFINTPWLQSIGMRINNSDIMDQSAEDLESLFDYSRVQPLDLVHLDDDELSSSPIKAGAKRKRADPKDANLKENHQNVVISLDDEEEDWMPPPPPMPANSCSSLEEDKILQELRLKKQELAAISQSAEEMLKAVKEPAKKEISHSWPSMQAKGDQPSKTTAERQKVLISIQDEGGQKQFFMYMDDKFARLFKMYAEKVQVGLDRLVFSFDGDRVNPDATPQGLGLEDDDMLEVHLKPQ